MAEASSARLRRASRRALVLGLVALTLLAILPACGGTAEPAPTFAASDPDVLSRALIEPHDLSGNWGTIERETSVDPFEGSTGCDYLDAALAQRGGRLFEASGATAVSSYLAPTVNGPFIRHTLNHFGGADAVEEARAMAALVEDMAAKCDQVRVVGRAGETIYEVDSIDIEAAVEDGSTIEGVSGFVLRGFTGGVPAIVAVGLVRVGNITASVTWTGIGNEPPARFLAETLATARSKILDLPRAAE